MGLLCPLPPHIEWATLGVFLIFVVFNSCEKSEDAIIKSPRIVNERTDQSENSITEGERKEIVLGNERINPFELSNMNAAADIAFGEDFPELLATHSYVKFKPKTTDDLVVLHDWSNRNAIPYFDFPLVNEIKEYGDFYVDPNVSDPLYTYQYASVGVEKELPQIPYEIIEELYINHNNPLLMAMSFDMAGHSSEIDPYVMKGGLVQSDIDDLDPSNLLRIPEEPIDCPEGCRPTIILNDEVRPFEFEWVCDCSEPPVPATNECGCPYPSNPRHPSGCVKVDNDTGDEPVLLAKVKVRDRWFSSDFAETDKNGCWVRFQEYRGEVDARIIFENENVKVRDQSYYLGIRVMHDRWVHDGGPPYRFYRHYNNAGDRREWACAHSINSDCNYRNAANADNIPQPRRGINVWIRAGSGAAGAPMLQGNPFNSWPSIIALTFMPLPYLASTGLHPDITNRYDSNESATNFISTAFHEYGHASHHTAVGESYWIGYRNHIINHNGYGTFPNLGGNNIGKCALGEGVANYIENRYGASGAGGEGFEWINNYIPAGLLFDLQDTNPDLVIDPNNTADRVFETTSGFTPSMFFDALPGSVDIRSFRNRLRTLHLSNTSNTPATYNRVVDVYDVYN